MWKFLTRVQRCRKGATAIEYSLLVGLIAAALIVLVAAVGGKTAGMWTNVVGAFPTA